MRWRNPVGRTASTAKYFLPRLLARFRREHEAVEVKLVVGNREQLVDMLRGNNVDIAIMGRPQRNWQLVLSRLRRTPMFLGRRLTIRCWVWASPGCSRCAPGPFSCVTGLRNPRRDGKVLCGGAI